MTCNSAADSFSQQEIVELALATALRENRCLNSVIRHN